MNTFPYSCLSFLSCFDQDKNEWSFGTITVISEKYGLTAGHLVLKVNKEHEVNHFDKKDAFSRAHGEIMVMKSSVENYKNEMTKISDFRTLTERLLHKDI